MDFTSLKNKTVVLLPAYNESKTIGHILKNLESFKDVLVVNDGSQDDTAVIAQKHDVRVLTISCNSGKGTAIKKGIQYALKNFEFEALIIIDADGQNDTEDIKNFLAVWESQKPDLLLGVRDLNSKNMPSSRRFWNKLVSFFISFLSGKQFSDSQSGFRMLSRKAVEVINLHESGYSVETEMLYEAVKNNLNIDEVRVQTIYDDNKNSNVLDNVYRAVKIFSYSIISSHKVFTKRVRAIFVALQERWSLASIAVAFLLLVAIFYQSLNDTNIARVISNNSFGLEMKTALEWLKENSEPEAIVMTHWFRGHQVVAFADRRVVSTTKVYPSEFLDVAHRYKDIGAFFLSESEETALDIAKKYDVSYVFLPKDLRAYLCKANNQCELAPGKRKLAPWAKQTIAGLMAQGVDLEHFKKVWESSRFVIYKITDEEQGLSNEAAIAATSIVRRTLEALLFENKKLTQDDFTLFLDIRNLSTVFTQSLDVDVTLWNDQQLRASQFGFGSSFVENLINGAISAANDPRFYPLQKEELRTTRIEVIIFKNDFSPIDNYLINASRIDPSKGYAVDHENRKTYFLPEIFNIAQLTDLSNLFGRLCNKGDMEEKCYTQSDVETLTFTVEDFIESKDKNEVFFFSGPLLIEDSTFSKGRVITRLRLAADWILESQNIDGSYVFKINTQTGSRSKNLSWVRNMLAQQSLIKAYELTGDSRYFISALKNREYLEDTLIRLEDNFPERTVPTASLIFKIFSDVELFKLTGRDMYFESAQSAATLLLSLVDEDGNFKQGFNFVDPNNEDATEPLDILNYQALTALSLFMQISQDTDTIIELESLANKYKNQFRGKRMRNLTSLSLAINAWLVNGFAELYRLTDKDEYVDFSLEVADWLLLYQTLGSPYKEGAFFNKPEDPYFYTRGTGKVAEALVDAYWLAKETGSLYRMEKYQNALELSFNWLMRMQLTEENSFWVNASIKESAIGGLRHDVLNPEIWSDSVSHFLLAGTQYVQHVK